jgi:hypothetical protein
MTNVVHTHGSPLNGVLQCKPELDFYIDKDMIYIADTKVAPRYGDFFVRNIQKFEEVGAVFENVCLLSWGQDDFFFSAYGHAETHQSGRHREGLIPLGYWL